MDTERRGVCHALYLAVLFLSLNWWSLARSTKALAYYAGAHTCLPEEESTTPLGPRRLHKEGGAPARGGTPASRTARARRQCEDGDVGAPLAVADGDVLAHVCDSDDGRLGAVLAIAEAPCTLECEAVTLLHRHHLALEQFLEGFLKFVSVTTMALLVVVYFGVRTYTSGFGSRPEPSGAPPDDRWWPLGHAWSVSTPGRHRT